MLEGVHNVLDGKKFIKLGEKNLCTLKNKGSKHLLHTHHYFNEVKNYIPPPEKVKKPKGAEQEIALSKFNGLLDVDELTR